MAEFLAEDESARGRLQHATEGVVATLLPSAQAQLSDFIAGVIAQWDTATITDKLELRIGKDLQFVRLNGTVVGFLVGGLLFAGLRLFLGAAVP